MSGRAGSIAVVVPTRDRPAALARCLRALGAQSVAVEIVVVDDGSRRPAAVAAAVAATADARLLRTAGVGPAAARNRGVAASEAEIVCFTDDDCEPDPDWAERLAAAARRAGRAAAGRTVLAAGAPPAARASQAIIDHTQLDSLDPRSGRLGFAPSCNLACTRQLAAEVPFDPGFRFAGGEDRDFSLRAAAGGAAPRYEPGAVVVHRLELGVRSFLGRQLRYGRGGSRFRRAHPDSGRLDPGMQLRLLRRAARRGADVALLVAVAQLATAAGAAFEAVTARRSSRSVAASPRDARRR